MERRDENEKDFACACTVALPCAYAKGSRGCYSYCRIADNRCSARQQTYTYYGRCLPIEAKGRQVELAFVQAFDNQRIADRI
jgi:hypothetical protein